MDLMKEEIKTKIREKLGVVPTKVAIFDFDGTLVNTPLPDKGKIHYQEKTSNPWPHKGWWSKPESLDMDIFDMPVVPDVIAAYKKEKTNPNTLLVMLTGRMSKMAKRVETILKTKGLSFDKYLYNTGGETGDAKLKDMDKLLNEYPSITEVEMWDDRIKHIPRFEAWGNKKMEEGRLKKFHVNLVPTDHHGE